MMGLKIEKAIQKAATLHREQFRKGEDRVPYVTHLFSVAMILTEYTKDEDIIIAGLLHDSLEDTAYTAEEMEKEFGKKVREIVEGVTEIKKENGVDIPWKTRKEQYLEQLKIAPKESVLVSVADKIHNLNSYIETHKIVGPTMWAPFHSNVEDHIWYFEEVLFIAKDRIKGALVDELADLCREARAEFL